MSAYFTMYDMREIVHCLNKGEEESGREILKQLQECREFYESVDVLELTPEQVREFELFARVEILWDYLGYERIQEEDRRNIKLGNNICRLKESIEQPNLALEDKKQLLGELNNQEDRLQINLAGRRGELLEKVLCFGLPSYEEKIDPTDPLQVSLYQISKKCAEKLFHYMDILCQERRFANSIPDILLSDVSCPASFILSRLSYEQQDLCIEKIRQSIQKVFGNYAGHCKVDIASDGMPLVRLSACLDWPEEYPNVSEAELTSILIQRRRMDKIYERRFPEPDHEDFKDERVDRYTTDFFNAAYHLAANCLRDLFFMLVDIGTPVAECNRFVSLEDFAKDDSKRRLYFDHYPILDHSNPHESINRINNEITEYFGKYSSYIRICCLPEYKGESMRFFAQLRSSPSFPFIEDSSLTGKSCEKQV